MGFRKVHMLEIKEILLRAANKESIRKISQSLGIHRKTIKNYLDTADRFGFDKDKKESITDDLLSKVKSQVLRSACKTAPRDDILMPLQDKIEAWLSQGLKGSKIICLLKREGIDVSIDSFYRFVRARCKSYVNKKITVRLSESAPGIYTQADFGKLGRIINEVTGEVFTVYALIITLCYSRHMYVHVCLKQDIVSVISGFEAAFAYFGAIPKIVIVDNLKPAVTKADRYSPVINKSFLEYSQTRGFVVDPAPISKPKAKAIVERMVPYVRNNFFCGEDFISVLDCSQRAVDWCSSVANTRVHGTTKKVPSLVFEEIEKQTLSPYPYDRYDIVTWATAKVHPDHHIRFKNSLYSIPTKYIGKTVEVRGDSCLVKVFYLGSLVKIHKTSLPGGRSTDFDDYPKELTPYTIGNPSYQIKKGYEIGTAVGDFIKEMLSGPYPWHRLRSAQKILRLAEKYGPEKLSAALLKARHYGINEMRRIENILKNNVTSIEETKEKVVMPKDNCKFLREPQSFNHYKT
jgi:hypothetical protein